MAMENSISISFTDAEKVTLTNAIQAIAGVMAGKGKSLTPKERSRYGRVKYEKEVWIGKVKTHMDQQPNRIPDIVDGNEFKRDYEAHTLINNWLNLLEAQYELLQDTNLLLGYDLDVNSLIFYRRIQADAKSNDPGAKTIYDDLKQQFPGPGRKKTAA